MFVAFVDVYRFSDHLKLNVHSFNSQRRLPFLIMVQNISGERLIQTRMFESPIKFTEVTSTRIFGHFCNFSLFLHDIFFKRNILISNQQDIPDHSSFDTGALVLNCGYQLRFIRLIDHPSISQ